MDLPIKPEQPPILCTLDERGMTARQAEIEALARRALIGRERGERTVRLTYRRGDGVEAAVRDLVRRESACCGFLSFAIEVEGERLVLNVTGPPGAEPVLDALYEMGGTPP